MKVPKLQHNLQKRPDYYDYNYNASNQGGKKTHRSIYKNVCSILVLFKNRSVGRRNIAVRISMIILFY